MNEYLQPFELEVIRSHSAVYESSLLATRNDRLRLSTVLKDYRVTTDVLDKGLRKLTVEDTLRERCMIIYAFNELILSMSLGPFTDEIDVEGDKLEPIRDGTRLSDHDCAIMAQYESAVEMLVALLEGSYAVIPGKQTLRIKAESFVESYSMRGRTEAALAVIQPVEPFGGTFGAPVVKKESLTDRIGKIYIDDGIMAKIVIVLVIVAVTMAYLYEKLA